VEAREPLSGLNEWPGVVPFRVWSGVGMMDQPVGSGGHDFLCVKKRGGVLI
jgi:hypothetical protein